MATDDEPVLMVASGGYSLIRERDPYRRITAFARFATDANSRVAALHHALQGAAEVDAEARALHQKWEHERREGNALLATYSFLPIIQAYAGVAGVPVESRDISLAGRILAQFPERLADDQRVGDALAELGELATRPRRTSSSCRTSRRRSPAEGGDRRAAGARATTSRTIRTTRHRRGARHRARYDKVKGSAVNPVLREGNSDRRAPHSVKQYARKHPHSMGAWSPTRRPTSPT